jgi:hypothetical protein
MARIYYKEEKIQGIPIETPVINLKNFDFLMTCPQPNFPIEFPLKFLDCFKLIRNFRFTEISNYGFTYNTSEGNFYLPKAIMFYDVEDCAFPTLLYFIAKIGEQLEIRLIRGGKGVEWFQTPDLQEPLTDSTIIKRIEKTLESVLAYLENYKEPEKPKTPKIQGITLDLPLMEQFLVQLNEQTCHAKKIVEMAESPSDYFDSNEKQLLEYQILDASPNMFLLYLVSLLEENKRMATVDWKAEYADVLYVLNELSGFEFENIDGHQYSRSGCGINMM